MKCRLVNKEITGNYGKELLECRGITNVEKYLNPTDDCIQDPGFLDNIAKGAHLLFNTIRNNRKILLIVDSDNDGYTSAAIMYQYIKKLNKDIEIEYYLHEGKQHGLEDHIDRIMEENDFGLVILPDSSSNDFKYHERLKTIGLPCLVLDHHITDEPISSNAIIINNQLSKNYSNKELTGAGVVYQFCRYLDSFTGNKYSEDLIDLAAWGIIGDMGSMLEMENRYIVNKGLNNIKNFFFKKLIEKQSYSMGDKITPITVAFYIVPLINAMIRVGTMEEKERLFTAFIDGERLVPSNKRGAKGQDELVAIESARECTNARTRQNTTKDKVVDSLEIKIHKNGLLDNKVLLIRLDEDDQFPSVLNGLVAMQLAAKFKKPTIVARLNDEGYVRGSARGMNQSELESFKNYLDSTHMFEYTAGHDNAFGVSIPNSKLKEFHEYSNEALKDIDFGENVYDVNFVRNASSKDLVDIVNDLARYDHLWGQNNDEPLIYVKDINLTPADIQIIGKNSDTLKIQKFGITFMKFHAKELIKELAEHDEIKMEIIGRANLNQWGGYTTPQIFIENYQIEDGKLLF